MNFLIVGDPIKNLNPLTDTSFSMAREALKRQHTVHWCTPDDLFLWDGRVQARVQNIAECQEKRAPSCESVEEVQIINSYDSVWIRKDPPFDTNYLAMCWLLALEEKNVPMLNPPSVLLRYHEKMIPFQAVEHGSLLPDELITSFMPLGKKSLVPSDFPRGESVTKPFFGHGGKEVERHAAPLSPEAKYFLQPLMKDISRTGDRRVLYIDGEIVGSYVRMPPEGEIKANIASGGTAHLKEMNKKEQDICNRLGFFLKEAGIVFAGADLMAEKISEVNITSPTGFETLASLPNGARLAGVYLNYVETLV